MIDKYFVRSYSNKVPRYKIERKWKGVCVMRISSISVAQPVNLNYKTRKRNVQSQPMSTQQPAFKGWKGLAGSVAGTVIGGAAGIILTGGLGVIPFLLAGTGTIAGGKYGRSKENNDDDYADHGSCCPSYRD